MSSVLPTHHIVQWSSANVAADARQLRSSARMELLPRGGPETPWQHVSGFVPADEDPLRVEVSSSGESKTTSPRDDPLQEHDPLQATIHTATDADTSETLPFHSETPNFEKRTEEILRNYKSKEHIAVDASFLQMENEEARLKRRQKQLMSKSGVSMSQTQFISLLRHHDTSLRKSWDERGDRVAALKVAIRIAKQLGDARVPKSLLPSLFCLAARILDSFGDRVFARLCGVCDIDAEQTQERRQWCVRPEQVHPRARVLCDNWFFKVVCIRELLPRILIELALLPCYLFVSPGKDAMLETCLRVADAIRGIADPQVAAFVRAYCAMRVFIVLEDPRGVCEHLFFDQLSLEKYTSGLTKTKNDSQSSENFENGENAENPPPKGNVEQNSTETTIEAPKEDITDPALHWIAENFGWRNYDNDFAEILKKVESTRAAVFVATHFPPDVVAKSAGSLLQFSDGTDTEKAALLCAVGKAVTLADIHKEKAAIDLLNTAWKQAQQLASHVGYLEVASVWMPFVRRNFSARRANILLQDVLRRRKESDGGDDYVNTIVEICASDLSTVFQMDAFLPLVDLLPAGMQHAVCTDLLRNALKDQSAWDTPTVSSLLSTMRILHDALDDVMAPATKRTEVGNMASSLCRQVLQRSERHRLRHTKLSDFVDARLLFFCECRRAFSAALDGVTATLCKLALDTVEHVRGCVSGALSKQLKQQVAAALAFLHVTLPSLAHLEDGVPVMPLTLLECLVRGATVAQQCELFGQSEGLFLTLLRQAKESEEAAPSVSTLMSMALRSRECRVRQWSRHTVRTWLHRQLLQLTHVCAHAPGHATRGPLYLHVALLRLLSATDKAKEESEDPDDLDNITDTLGDFANHEALSPGERVSLLTAVASAVTSQHRDTARNGSTGVSNRELYYGDPAFNDESHKVIHNALTMLMRSLSLMPPKEQGLPAMRVFAFVSRELRTSRASCALLVRLTQAAVSSQHARALSCLSRENALLRLRAQRHKDELLLAVTQRVAELLD
ncbi:MAG: hypothetical protein MHM6MM_003346 [Cercozoa sp. M6MM]